MLFTHSSSLQKHVKRFHKEKKPQTDSDYDTFDIKS